MCSDTKFYAAHCSSRVFFNQHHLVGGQGDLGQQRVDEYGLPVKVSFRGELGRLGTVKTVFAEVNRRLEGRGPVVKAGTLVFLGLDPRMDATLVPAAAAEAPKQKGGALEGRPGRGLGRAGQGRSPLRLQAARGGGRGHGRGAAAKPAPVATANVNEITVGPEMSAGDEGSVWADKA